MGLETGVGQSAATRPPPGEQKPVPAGLGDKQEGWGGRGVGSGGRGSARQSWGAPGPGARAGIAHTLPGVVFPARRVPGSRFRASWAPCGPARSVDPRPRPERAAAAPWRCAARPLPGLCVGAPCRRAPLVHPGAVYADRNTPTQVLAPRTAPPPDLSLQLLALDASCPILNGNPSGPGVRF